MYMQLVSMKFAKRQLPKIHISDTGPQGTSDANPIFAYYSVQLKTVNGGARNDLHVLLYARVRVVQQSDVQCSHGADLLSLSESVSTST